MQRVIPLLVLFIATPAIAARVHLRSEDPAFPCRGNVVALSNGERHVRHVDIPADVNLPSGVAHTVRLESDTCWAADVSVSPADMAVTMSVFPRATISGRLTGDAPPYVELRITSADAGTTLIPSQQCRTADARFACAIPAIPIHVKIGAPGRVPHYIWNTRAKAGGALDIGTLRLPHGNSVAGRLLLPRDVKALPTVELIPDTLAIDAARKGEAHYTARANAEGFFQFTDVADGDYRLVATLDGFSPLRVPDIVVARSAEVFLSDSLRFPPLSRLEVIVQPALSPGGQPWQYALRRQIALSNFTAVVTQGSADSSGAMRVERLPIDTYGLQILDEHGAVFRNEEITIAEAEGLRFVRLEHVAVRGTVTAGTEPIAAEVTFLMTDGTRASARSTTEGTYAVVLPRSGSWRVEVRPEKPRQVIRLRKVDVMPNSDGVANVDLALPRGRIKGRVIDDAGKPVALNVDVLRNGKPETRGGSEAKDGRFEIIGVLPGDVTLEASGGDLHSGSVPYRVANSSMAEDVTIVAFRKRKIAGFVTTRDGVPVPGALLRCTAPEMFSMEEVVTGPSGDFVIEVPRAIAAVDVVVVARNAPVAIKALNVREPASENVVITLGAHSGLLRIDLRAAKGWPYLRRTGGFVVLTSLFYPRGADPPNLGFSEGTFTTALEPGEYVICPTAAVSEQCTAAVVRAGETATIDAARLWGASTRGGGAP